MPRHLLGRGQKPDRGASQAGRRARGGKVRKKREKIGRKEGPGEGKKKGGSL